MWLLTDQQRRQFGLTQQHLQQVTQGDRSFYLDAQVVTPWRQLQAAAAEEGFDLQLVSSYRGFDRQLAIWQAKAFGKRILLDDAGVELNFSALTQAQRLQAIMRWSAVPGLSRHHWGTDIDVFDANCMALDQVQLVPGEVDAGGVFSPLHEWLDERVKQSESFGFYRPYHCDDGGVAPERWHLSCLPISCQYMVKPDRDSLLALWLGGDMAFSQRLADDFDAIFARYVDLSVQGQPGWVAELLIEWF